MWGALQENPQFYLRSSLSRRRCLMPYVEVLFLHHNLRWTLSSCLPRGLEPPHTAFHPEPKARRDESTGESAARAPGLPSNCCRGFRSVQSSTATIGCLLSLSEDQTHPQMSHCSNSISRSDRLSLGRGLSSQQVQSTLASRAGPFLFSVMHPEPLLSPHC